MKNNSDTVFSRAWLEADLPAVVENIKRLTDRMPEGIMKCATVKADGYGIGAPTLAAFLDDKIDYFAVSSENEALELREGGCRRPILILGKTWPENFEAMLLQEIRINIFEESDAVLLSETACRLGRKAHVHISVNTGMNRIGFAPTEESAQAIRRISHLPGIVTEGLFSHFASADESDQSAADRQWACFCRFSDRLKELGVDFPIRHMANSATALLHPERALDMVRLGISMYGVSPLESFESGTELVPVFSMKARVSFVKELQAGEGIGYGLTYTTQRYSRIATVPVGYADGYCRSLSNCGKVLIQGKEAPVVGRVCMDQMMIDVTDIPETSVGDIVTLFGSEGELRLDIAEVAETAGISPYEFLVNLSRKRLPHLYRT